MKKVLITGATGFIGSHLVERNVKEGNRVRVFALPNDPLAKEVEARNIDVVYGDIRDDVAVERAVKDMEIVFHLAAVVTDWAPKELFEKVNVEGTKNICEASLRHGVKRFVELSTNDVFGLKEDAIIDETCAYSHWGEPYADTKLEATKIVREFGKKGLPVTMVYACWVYGPGDVTFVPLVADAIKNGELIFWRKNVIVWPAYVENVIDLLMVISEHPKAVGQGFLVHDGVSDTFQNFSAKIAESIGEKTPKLHIPYWSAYAAAWLMESAWKILKKKSRPLLTTYTVKNLGSRLRFSINKAEKLLGWTPPISYEEGFEKTMAWLRQTDPGLWKQK
ncbi:MAG: NAD-dependent epimerase/dehydratase family protein [bacterium]